MKVTVFGSGYVGLVTGVCLADVGNEVLCVDIDAGKIERLKNADIPIYEPGLEDLVIKNQKAGTLSFATDIDEGVKHGLFQFIAVGTPPDEDGSADLQYVTAVASSIGQHMDDYKVIIDKSTVPVGTADKVKVAVQEQLDSRKSDLDFDVVSNPEFLKEGAAITDFMKPDRIVIGVDNKKTEDLMRSLYAPFNRNHDRLIAMDIRSAELTKYAANAMLATKISFMNELSHIAERTGANIEQVRIGIGADSRIGYHFIYAGPGYGGSCFPKDVNALVRTAHEFGYNAELLESVENVNYRQKHVLFEKIKHHFNGELKGKIIALWGLSFKPNTDDMREAPSRVLMEKLWEEGVTVKAHDPKAMEETARIYGERDDLVLCDKPEDVLDDADALVLMTEWHIFQSPDFELIKSKLKQPAIFDGRNIFKQETMDEYGFSYYAIGRGKQVFTKD